MIKKHLGFTLIEVIVTVAIIAVVSSLLVVNHNDFSSKSSLRVRAQDIVETIRLAQSISSSSFDVFEEVDVHSLEESISSLVGDLSQYSVVTIEVDEDSKLIRYKIDQTIRFSQFLDVNNENTTISLSDMGEEVLVEGNTKKTYTIPIDKKIINTPVPEDEQYITKYCFIGNPDCSRDEVSTDVDNYSDFSTIRLFIQYPTEEVYGTVTDTTTIPTPSNSQGIRLMLSSDGEDYRAFDIIKTGLIDFH